MPLLRALFLVMITIATSGCAVGVARMQADSCEVRGVAVGNASITATRIKPVGNTAVDASTVTTEPTITPCAELRGGTGSPGFYTMLSGVAMGLFGLLSLIL